MYKIAICEDDMMDLQVLSTYVRRYSTFKEASNSPGVFKIDIFSDPQNLAKKLREGISFDIYLLDIIMPNYDGIEIARLIRETDKNAIIIFMTGCNDRAIDAFNVNASQYLLKPVSFEALSAELDYALEERAFL